jgi:hypothetical protein
MSLLDHREGNTQEYIPAITELDHPMLRPIIHPVPEPPVQTGPAELTKNHPIKLPLAPKIIQTNLAIINKPLEPPSPLLRLRRLHAPHREARRADRPGRRRLACHPQSHEAHTGVSDPPGYHPAVYEYQ